MHTRVSWLLLRDIFRVHLFGNCLQKIMKQIFNWMHRKFHSNVDCHSFSHIKEGVSQNEKKAETVKSENDTEKLLDHVTFPDIHECWNDGLLSIGTFGFDFLKPYNNLNGHFVEQRDEDEDDDKKECPVTDDEEEGKEELNPLVVKVFKREFEKVLLSSLGSVRKPDLSTTVDDDDIDTPLLRFLESAELQTNHENSARDEIEQKKKKGERTTLADLFSAEADATDDDSGNSYSGIVHKPAAADRLEKPTCRKKQGLSFLKKFISPKADDDSPPIRKLHRLVKRMVKKKIHPEVEGKVYGMNGPFDTLNSEMGGGDAAAAPTESSFLLQGCERKADV